MPTETTLYDAVGGMPFFERLVDAFYERVALTPALLALYPEPDDLAPARQRLTLFLAQYWGGPTTYSDTRGHPRLRMRHAPFAIDSAAHDAWLACMDGALRELAPPDAIDAALREYFVMVARAMQNRP